ncbi:cytochrome-c peroxidase [Eudoraea adriatica]|uniref:cytochrome-c peroxidase n=1 Tax=Eudoraea adriatica TaxID=446681 RepID=UPI00036F1554|nr:cytochrome c peroxidase [Eudoraea adriatica]
MKKIVVFFSFLIIGACKNKIEEKEYSSLETTKSVDWGFAQNYYYLGISNAIREMEVLEQLPAETADAKRIFKKVRQEFKKAEPYASYLNPAVGHRTNGPALPVFTEDTERVLAPIGLQKIEESIYEGNVPEAVYKKEIAFTLGMMRNLQQNIENRQLNPERFFIATHQQLMRIISLGISGFDTPVSHLGFEETIISLEGLVEVYNVSIQNIILEKDKMLDTEFHRNIKKAIAFIKKDTNFETFDRYTFIREHMNPITRNWVAIRKASALWNGVNSYPFNFDATTFFEKDAFNVTYFTPTVNRNPSEKQIALGEKLFFEPKLSKNGAMACVSCHNPNKAFADNLVYNLGNDGKPLQRNSPTLINAVFQKGFFWDGRAENLLDQISSVFTNEKEFNTSVHEFSLEIVQDSTYTNDFKEVFGNGKIRNADVIKALSSYISTLNAFDSKFDRNMRGEESTFTSEEKLGMNLFMGKALCATCHFIPLTNGTVPPFFSETEKEVIGIPETAANQNLDDDLGFYWKFNEDIHLGMFKTPTVRNAEYTAPYMHNGVYNTLEEVMDFYNKGGGAGMGFDLEHQTLPFDELNLTDEEQKALVAFVKTLSDTNVSSTGEVKYELASSAE